MRVGIVSDAPWAPSGYGVQARHLGAMLRDLGHEVAFLAAFGLHGGRQEYRGIPVYPGGMDGFGNDAVAPFVRDWRPDILLTLKDVWVYRPQEWGAGVRWVPLVPVDHDPIPFGIVQMLRQHAYATIAYAPFGQQQLHDAGFAPHYAPHVFDPAVLSPQDKAEARQALGMPGDVFAVGMVAVNRGGVPSRKAWPQNLEGFAQFARQHPRARLYCHTHVGSTGREGAVNLPALAESLGISDRISFVEQTAYDAGLPDSYMRAFYSAIDVLNAVSVGEGFGVPTLEAQACGTPVLIGDWTASADLLFAGAAVSKDDAHRFYDAQGSYIFLPEPHAIAGGLAHLAERLSDPVEAARLRDRAIAGASEFAVEHVRETHWRPAMAALAARIAREVSRGVVRIVEPASILGVSDEADQWAAAEGVAK
jgi:glycosyltransferase involved in cell wall biosynthesis